MNSEIRIQYENDLPVSVTSAKVTNYPLHCHPDTIEIIYVLKGTVDVKASFENFVLKAGDFVIVNHGDFHFIKGNGEDNVVLSLFIDLSYLEKSVGHIRYIEFVCESFLIKDNRKEHVGSIRNLIQDITVNMILKRKAYEADVTNETEQIISLLVEHFTLLQHYSNEQKLSGQKLEKYYKIAEKLDEGYQNKGLLEDISRSEFYSKFYLAHLYKGLMMMSIQDSLSAMRCFKAEVLLLTTDRSIQQISTECGFSDTKYFYKHFNKWFRRTPAQYRKQYQAEIRKEKIIEEIAPGVLLKLLPEPVLLATRETGAPAGEEESGLFHWTMVDLFGNSHSADAGYQGTSAVNWNSVDEILRRIKETGLRPYVAMDFNSRTANDWLNLLKTCCLLYETEIRNWEFCFYYTKTVQKESLRKLISDAERECSDIKISAMQLWNGNKPVIPT